MLKTLLSAAAITLTLTLPQTSVAGEKNFVLDPTVEKNLIRICKAIKSDRRIALYKRVKNAGLKFSDIGKNLKCNGQDPVTFALSHGAESNASFIATRTNQNYDVLYAKHRTSSAANAE